MDSLSRDLGTKSSKGVIYKDLKACANFKHGLEKANKVQGKVQLILGSNDFLTPKFKAQNLIEAFKNPSVEEVKGSGHSLMMEEPNKVLEYLKKLLDN